MPISRPQNERSGGMLPPHVYAIMTKGTIAGQTACLLCLWQFCDGCNDNCWQINTPYHSIAFHLVSMTTSECVMLCQHHLSQIHLLMLLVVMRYTNNTLPVYESVHFHCVTVHLLGSE